MMKRKPLKELQEIARLATRSALEPYESLSERYGQEVTLGETIDGEYRVFELYYPGERPEDAIVITQAWVHSITGEVLPVKVTNLRLRSDNS